MKIVAIYGSDRKKGFSSLGVDYAVAQFKNSVNEIKKYRLSDMNFGGCKGCFACRLKEGCVQQDDMTELFGDIISSDFVIFSSPVYCFSLCGNYMKMFERLYPMLDGNKGAAGVRKRAESNYRHNGFIHLGTVVIDGTYTRKERCLEKREKQKIKKICNKP